jgi:hypothetical protein
MLRWARWLDEWLQTKLGRPYNVILGIGLVSEIVDRISHLSVRLQPDKIVRDALVLAVEFALLLHQIGALSHHIEHRRARRTGPGATAEVPENEIAGQD